MALQISELITKLQDILEREGDHAVTVEMEDCYEDVADVTSSAEGGWAYIQVG